MHRSAPLIGQLQAPRLTHCAKPCSFAQINSLRWMLVLGGLPLLAFCQMVAVQASGASILVTLLVVGLAAAALAAPRGPILTTLPFRPLPSGCAPLGENSMLVVRLRRVPRLFGSERQPASP